MSENRGLGGAAVMLVFLLGGAFGALTALLYAPESGRRTRVRIRRLTEVTSSSSKRFSVTDTSFPL